MTLNPKYLPFKAIYIRVKRNYVLHCLRCKYGLPYKDKLKIKALLMSTDDELKKLLHYKSILEKALLNDYKPTL